MRITRMLRTPLPYPYTLGAKIMQFPWKFHWEKSWWFRYYVYGVLVCTPVFYKIQQASMASEPPKKKDH